MESKEIIEKYEAIFKQDLNNYLLSIKEIDEMFPDAPDIEERWAQIGKSYMPDGMREFTNYPSVSLGWMMYIGMAIAKYWDEDWKLYSKVEDLYAYLRDRIDYDHMDDYIREKVLLLSADEAKQLQEVVAECGERTFSLYRHQNIQPSSTDAFYAYVAALHEMYLMGSAVQLKRMGYHMTKL